MFIGHYAIAFGAKRFAPQVSLGALFLACQLADLIWPNLVLAGIERVAIELALFGAGVWLYARATTPVDRLGRIGLWALVGFLLVVFAANLLGPPPPSVVALAWSAQAMWLLVAVGYWIDRHRKPAVG